MRRAMPYPCRGPRTSSVLRIISASVPCFTSSFSAMACPMGFQYDGKVDVEVSGRSFSDAGERDAFGRPLTSRLVGQTSEQEPGDEHERPDGHRHHASTEWNRVPQEHAGDR